MKIYKPVFDAYSREISKELELYNAEVCKIKHDAIKEKYYQTKEGKLIKSVQEIDTSSPLINMSSLHVRMKLTACSNFQVSVIYNKFVIFSVKTDDYDVLKEMVLNHFKEKINTFYK